MAPCAVPIANPVMRLKRYDRGFTLVELLLAAALGALFCGLAAQLLIGELAHGSALARRLQLRRLQRRTLMLVKGDLSDADHWQLQPAFDPSWRCSMAGRQPLIAISTAEGTAAVVYSLGRPPSSIWRGQVLMRCGPSFDLQGQPNLEGAYQSRVVLDQVEALLLEQDPQLPLLRLEIQQRLPGSDQLLRSSAVG